MIQYVYEDLFDAEADYLMEQKNCFHIHGGLSGEMARRYPAAAEADLATAKGDKNKLGTYEIVDCEDIKVINAYGQYSIGGNATDFDAWEDILDSLKEELNAKINHASLHSGATVKVPYKIGCGLGGGVWEEMEEILDWFFADGKITLKICIRKQDEEEAKYYEQRYDNGKYYRCN